MLNIKFRNKQKGQHHKYFCAFPKAFFWLLFCYCFWFFPILSTFSGATQQFAVYQTLSTAEQNGFINFIVDVLGQVFKLKDQFTFSERKEYAVD